jgi:hypothetical protein
MNYGRVNAFRVNGSVASLSFGAISALSTSPLGYSCLRADGTIYNFGTGCWDQLNPSTGIPTTNQYQALASFSAQGPLSKQQFAQVPEALLATCGIWFAIFQLDATGSIVSQVDNYPCFPEYMSIQ